MRFFRTLFITTLTLSPIALFATDVPDSSTAVSQLNLLIAQYESRIKQLESENAVLRYEMVKAGIKIPLTDYSGAILSPLPTSVSQTSPVVVASTGTSTTSGVLIGSTSVVPTTVSSVSLTEITTKYGKDVSGFISRINQDWQSIKDFYKLSSGARLAGYEFVQSADNDHVFVDIVIGTGTTGIYDMKILYQFEKTAYKRKLIGIFDYNSQTERYVTRAGGNNPFAGISRNFIRDPYYAGTVTIPVTAGGMISSSGTTASTTTQSPVTTPVIGSVSVADITKAYSEKKYLSTISLSNTYLEKNKATTEILNIRYRTFFIIGKYTESLAELAKMETLGALDRQTACNAQVIATYSKNTTLVNKYAAICKK